MGDFTYVSFRVLVCFAVWGLATGIGLWCKWRWARISMLVFGGIFVAAEPCYLRSCCSRWEAPAEWTSNLLCRSAILMEIRLHTLPGELFPPADSPGEH